VGPFKDSLQSRVEQQKGATSAVVESSKSIKKQRTAATLKVRDEIYGTLNGHAAVAAANIKNSFPADSQQKKGLLEGAGEVIMPLIRT